MPITPDLDRHPELTSQDADYARLLEHDPSRVEVWRMRTRIALQQRNNDRAVALLEEAVRVNPGQEALLEDLANLYLLKRDPAAARPIVERLLQADGDTPEHIFSRARLLWLEGAYDEAIGLFKQAIEKQPEEARFLISLIRSLVSVDAIPEALHSIARFGATAGSAEMMGLLAQYRFDVSGIDAALEAVDHGLRQSPQHPTLHYLRAALRTLSGDPRHAKGSIALVEGDELMGSRWRGFLFARAQGDAAVFCGLGSALLERSLKAAPAAGVVAEFGVYHGLSLRRLARHVASPIHGFDSFDGLPEDWKPGEPKGSYSTHGRVPEMPEHVRLHRGWFEDTLPGFVAAQHEKLRFVHVDCDLYSSTCTVLEGLRPLLQTGTVLLFDEYLGYEGFEQHEFRAWQEFTGRHGIRYEYIAFELIAKQAAVRITAL